MAIRNLLAIFTILLVSSKSFGAQATFVAGVEKILLDDDLYSGCMAKLSVSPADELAGCGNNWVVLDCDRSLGGTATQASQKLSAMQLAMVTSTNVTVRITDSAIANSYCKAVRVDNFAP